MLFSDSRPEPLYPPNKLALASSAWLSSAAFCSSRSVRSTLPPALSPFSFSARFSFALPEPSAAFPLADAYAFPASFSALELTSLVALLNDLTRFASAGASISIASGLKSLINSRSSPWILKRMLGSLSACSAIFKNVATRYLHGRSSRQSQPMLTFAGSSKSWSPLLLIKSSSDGLNALLLNAKSSAGCCFKKLTKISEDSFENFGNTM